MGLLACLSIFQLWHDTLRLSALPKTAMPPKMYMYSQYLTCQHNNLQLLLTHQQIMSRILYKDQAEMT